VKAVLFVSAHFSFVALKQVIAMKAGRCSAMNWRRPPGLDVLERHGYRYSRLVMEQQPAGDRRGRMQRNVDIVESHRNGPQPSMRHDDDDDCLDWWLLHSLCFILISDKPWVYPGLMVTPFSMFYTNFWQTLGIFQGFKTNSNSKEDISTFTTKIS